MGSYPYILSGVRVALPFPLPLLRQDPGMAAWADLPVHTAALPVCPASAISVGLGLWVDDDAIWFDLAKVGRLRLDEAGLTLDLEREADPVLFEQILVGHVMGAVLHQAGVLPLHASCVVRGGGAVAFVGSRGVGKSTLAAALHARGWSMLADDLVAVRGAARPLAWPGPARQRLSLDALTALGLSAETAIKIPAGDKWLATYHAPTWETVPVPLRAVVELVPGFPGTERFDGAEAAAALHRHTFRRRLLAPMGRQPDNSRHCATLASQVAVFRLSRPDDLQRLEALVDRVEALLDPLVPRNPPECVG